MRNKQRRMAGQALAALPEENISQQLTAALERLRQVTPGHVNNDDYGYVNNRIYPVPGESNSVNWASAPTDADVAFGPDGFSGYDGRFQVGNASELKRIEDAGINDIIEIAWDSPGIEARPAVPAVPTRTSLADTRTPQNIRKAQQLQDKRTALTARSSWPDYLSTLPDNVLLHNRPAGFDLGDYSRADLYMREGFGPVGENGAQYAIKRNGQLLPVAPMGTNKAYAEHMLERLDNSGASDISADISSELQRRETNRNSLISPEQLEEERLEREYRERGGRAEYIDDYPYDDGDYDSYDDGEYENPETARFFAQRSFNNLSNVNTLSRVRDVGNQLEDAGILNGLHVMEMRMRQEEIARGLSQAADNLNFVNSRVPRPLPTPITSSPYNPNPEYRRDRLGEKSVYNNVDELAAVIRDGGAYHLAESTPENLRGYVKQRFVQPTMRPDGVLEMRENYGPTEVQMLRDLQVQQALNPAVEGSGPAAYGISPALDMVSSDVPVQWITQGGQSRGPARPITGAGGTERTMNLRARNFEQDGVLRQGNTVWGYNKNNVLQRFVDEAGGDPKVLFPGNPNVAIARALEDRRETTW